MAGLNVHHRRFVNPHDNHEKLQRVTSLVFKPRDVQPSAVLNFNRHFEENEPLVEMERPTKRRRIENNGNDSTNISFRLVSWDLSPRILTLERPAIIKRPKSPEVQDTPQQRRQRRVQAKEAAVETHEIMRQLSNQRTTNQTTKDVETDVYRIAYSSTPSMSIPSIALLTTDETSPSHQGGAPRLVVTKDAPVTIKKRRRRFKPKPIRPRPTFWRPTPGMGAKATGYALGYEGSWATQDSSEVSYKRDMMKRIRDAYPSHFDSTRRPR